MMRRAKTLGKQESERDRRVRLARVTEAMSGFRPAREVLSLVRSVPTVLVQFDHAIRTGGWPVEVVTIAHGASNQGKTSLMLLLGKSFLDAGHFFLHVDAERTTPIDWARLMIGPKADDDVQFKAIRPDTYEDAVDEVRRFCNAVKRLRDAGHVTPDTTALVAVDSLRKLTPKNFFAQATKIDEADPMRGRGPMIKAKWNTAWMDEVTHLVDSTGTGFFAIAREYEDQDANAGWGDGVKVGGGMGIVFDSSLIVRVSRASWVTEKPGDERQAPAVFGERHRVTIKKTKVGGKDGKVTTCYFHTSNGTLTPPGHDRARDVLDLARRFGIIDGASWLSWGKVRIGQGEHRSVVKLTEDAGMLADLEATVRASFAKNEPTETDASTGEVTR